METLLPDHDAYSPREIAHRTEQLGIAKTQSDGATLLVLAVLAGAFISLGALFFTVVITGSSLGFGITRLLGGLAFSLGLILVVVGGGELFTGNNLIAMAWASGRITTRQVVHNWLLVYVGNVIGCLGTVVLALWTHVDALAAGAVGDSAVDIARAKAALSFGEGFARGILCNAFVCLAVWLAMGGRSVTDKILSILFPITAFVAIGLEQSRAILRRRRRATSSAERCSSRSCTGSPICEPSRGPGAGSPDSRASARPPRRRTVEAPRRNP